MLGENYQYILATHVDHEHIHNHIIVNNTNSNTHNTFETEFNQGKKSERAWAKVRELSDEICKKHCLSVIQNPENNRGKTHYEWDMSRQGLSWKAKLKFAIDNTIKESEDFEDFLRGLKQDDIKAECLLPLLVDHLITAGRLNVAVLHSDAVWFGVTYQEDRPTVAAELAALHKAGAYPEKLFG